MGPIYLFRLLKNFEVVEDKYFMKNYKKIFFIINLILLGGIIILLIFLGIFTSFKISKQFILKFFEQRKENQPYYLVYVNTSGGMSYYGQIKKEEKDYLILKDPAYLNIQSPEKEGDQPKITLQLMKDEFFRPLPEMKIYKNAIVFIQQLSEDSPILSAYRQLQNK